MNDGDCHVRESELARDGVRLHCRSVEPAGATVARLAIVHGYGEHSGRYIHFMRWMAERGVSCTAVDLRGHGRSSGRRGFVVKWEEYLDDIQEFIGGLTRETDTTPGVPLFLLGHSHGGLVSAAAAERGMLGPVSKPNNLDGRRSLRYSEEPGFSTSDPALRSTSETGVTVSRQNPGSDDVAAKLRGCILSSPYLATTVPPPVAKRIFARAANHVVPWLRVRSNLQAEWLSRDEAMLADDRADDLMNRTATPRWFLTMRKAQTRVRNEASSFKLPVLLLIGESDVIADPAATAEFYQRAGSADKSIYAYPQFVHELLREVGREKVFADIFGWIKARI